MYAYLGLDPGGTNSYGIAILSQDRVTTTTVSDTLSALEWIKQQLDEPPLAVGIDAPLWWSAGLSGGRAVDAWLRWAYKGRVKSSTVQSVNSLRGAVLAQGMLFVQDIRKVYPKTQVTETHPKALLQACYEDDFDLFCHEAGLSPVLCNNDHERDAIISAMAAREGCSGHWKDLSDPDLHPDLARLAGEQDPKKHWLKPVHYWWPVLLP